MSVTTIILLVIIGLVAGLLSGLIGIGGGVVMVPLFIMLLGYQQHQAQGMSLAVMLPPVTLLAALNYNKEGTIDWKMALVVSLCFVIGGFLGSKLALKIDNQTLKKIFGVVMLVIATKMIFGK